MTLDLFKSVILMQLFYAFAITLLVNSLPADQVPFIQSYSNLSTEINLNNVSNSVQDTMTRQTQVSVVDLGALVLFSGNILLDLLVNFAFALPQMITLLINGIILLLNIDAEITVVVQTFATVVVMVMYFLGLLTLLTNIRARGTVI